METLISAGFDRADRFRDASRYEAQLGTKAGGLAGAIMGGGNFGSAGMSRFTQSQNYHADQYGYFTGYPYAIINVIANRLASQPIRVARKIPAGRKPAPGRAIKQAGDGTPLLPKSFHDISDQLEILPDHRLLRAIADPNPIMIRHHLLYATFASLEITGRGYWWMYTDPETKKDQIWPLPTHWVEPYHDPETDQLYAFYRVTLPGTGQQVKVPRRQIVPFMMSDPSDPFSALSPMTAMARTVMTDFAFETAQRMSLENGVNPGLAIMVGKPPDFAGVGGDQMVLTADQRAQIVAAVKRQYRGVTRFDEPLILDALIRDVKPITTSPREMAFKDSGPLVRNRMTQGWGMNPITLGEIEGVNYASSGVADHHVCRTVFGPRTESNSQTLTCYVPHYLPDRSLNVPDGEIIVYQEPVQPTDPEMEMTRDWGDYDRAILSQNELRRKRGLPPLVDGDRALTPTGWVPVQTEEQAREQSTPGGAKSFVMGSKVRDDSGHEHDADGRFGSGGGGSSGESKPATKPKDEYKPGTAAHGNNGSVNDSDHEQAKRAAGFMGKLKKLGKKAVLVAKIAAVAAKHCIDEGNEFLIKTRLADDIIDNADDWGMITNSHAVKEQLGMGGQMAAKAVSVVAGYAFTKLRQYVHAKRAKKGFTLNSLKDGKKETIGDVAKKVHRVLVAVMGPKGAGAAIDELPTVKMIAAKLASAHDDNKRAEIKKKSGRVIQQVRSAALVVDNRRKLEEQKVAALLAPVFHHLGQKAAMVLREELRKSPHHQVDELVHRVIDRKLWEDALTPAVTEALKAAVMGGSLAEWGLYLQHRQNVQKSGEERKTLPRRFLDAAQKVADEIVEKGFVSTIVSGVMNLVGRFFTRGKEKGLVGSELADFVAGKSLVGSAAEKAADEIARNDGGAAVNEGQSVVRLELAKSGEIAGVRWVSMHDGRVRPTHQKADGQTIQPHGFFTVGGHQCKHPGDSSLPMDERAGCRCQAVTIYKE